MNQEDKEFIGSSPCPLRIAQLSQAYRTELDGSVVNKNLEKEVSSTGNFVSEWTPKHPCELFGGSGLAAMLNFPARQLPPRMCKKSNRELLEPCSNVFK